ncbi:unnamed protein product [Aureobasidium mustum]|uniref:Translocation protein-like protein sec66 n=1 Tax=Aureobasidium mustum TaxID=2773714 RepID=A0A9N8PER4_9PEZI|nr:unnamed protein product [Aureobasidium mustum]
MVDWVGLLIPLAYLSILIGSLATFSSLYRRRKAQKSANLAPWFPPHLQRNIYLSLLHLDPQDSSSTPEGSEKSLSQIPDSIIRAALLRRAVEDIHRIIQIRNAKPALQTLLQRGSVGDELWQRFQRAEQEIEEEVKDVVSEANALVPNWGQIIFQSANEIANNQLAKQRMEDIQSKLPEEKAWWDKKKQGIQSQFMKELDDEAAGSRKGSVTSTSNNSRKGSVASVAGQNEDAVLVETPGSAKKKSKK